MACNLIINIKGIGDITIPNISIEESGELTNSQLLEKLKTLPESEVKLIHSVIDRELNKKSNLTKLTPQNKGDEPLKGQMTFSYGPDKRPNIKATSTFQAIQTGERTATTRYESDGNIDYWKNAKIGDKINWSDSKNNILEVEVTKPLTKLRKNTSAENWSKKEGWSTDYFNNNVKPKIDEAWQMEFKLSDQPSTAKPVDTNQIVKEPSIKEIYREDSTLRKRLFDNNGGTTTRDILSKISDSKSPLAILAKTILSSSKEKYLDRSVNLVEGEVGENGKYEGVRGEYMSGQITIYENAQFKNGQAERTIMHEIMHSITSDATYKAKNTQLGKDLNDLFEYAKNNKLRDLYAFNNVHEFIAEVYTNSELITDLQKIKPIEGFTEYKNFFQQVVDKLLQIVGIAKKDNLYKQASALVSNLLVDEAIKQEPEKRDYSLNYIGPDESQAPFSKSTAFYEKSKDSKEKIVDIVDKLRNTYGTNIQVMSAEEISSQFKNTLKENPAIHRAFIHDGKIYVNADLASTAEPLHEMSHLILGTIKSSNSELYSNIISSIRDHPAYESIARSYKERSGSDLDEEVFSTIFAEQYRDTKRKKGWDTWYDSNKSFFQNIIDFIKEKFSNIFGNKTILNLSNEEFMDLPLDSLIEKYGNDLMGGKFKDLLAEDISIMERKVTNLKSKLLDDGILKSDCK